jgi:invasion protein IalB
MAGKKTASLLAAVVVLSSAPAPASVYRESEGEPNWSSGRGFLAANPDEQSQAGFREALPHSAPQRTPITLPNGADEVKEIYGDWGVICRMIQSTKRCSAGHYQFDEKQQALMFSIEIFPPQDGGYAVAVTMPFGLSLPDGIILKLDGQVFERGGFATCFLGGCLVPLKFTSANIETMKSAKTLTVDAKAYAGGNDARLSVSLKGFSAAIERLRSLQQ